MLGQGQATCLADAWFFSISCVTSYLATLNNQKGKFYNGSTLQRRSSIAEGAVSDGGEYGEFAIAYVIHFVDEMHLKMCGFATKGTGTWRDSSCVRWEPG